MTGNANTGSNHPHPMPVQSHDAPWISFLDSDRISVHRVFFQKMQRPALVGVAVIMVTGREASCLKFSAVEAEMEKGCYNCAYFLFKEACSEDLSLSSGKCFLGFVEKNKTQWVQGNHFCENWSWERVSANLRF